MPFRIAVEADGLSSAEATELAEMDRRKEAAAARVSEAMQRLEIMSNEIHERRKERGGEEDAGSEYGGSEALDDTVSSNGDAAEVQLQRWRRRRQSTGRLGCAIIGHRLSEPLQRGSGVGRLARSHRLQALRSQGCCSRHLSS